MVSSSSRNKKAVKRPNVNSNAKTKGKKQKKVNTKIDRKFRKTIKTPNSISTVNKYCSPYGNLNRVKKGSCFSPDAVLNLIEGYNNKYPLTTRQQAT